MRATNVLFFTLSLIFAFFDPLDQEAYRVYMLCGFFWLYNIGQFYYLPDKRFFFIKPIFCFFVATFLSSLGMATNFFVVKNQQEIFAPEFNSGQFMIKDYGIYLKTLLAINIASIAAWMGYQSYWGISLYKKYAYNSIYARVFNSEIDNNKLLIFGLLAYLIKAYLFSIGLFGRMVDERFFEAGVGYKDGSQLRIFANASLLFLFLFGVHTFRNFKQKNILILGVCLAIELVYGFAYAARSAIVYPFVLVFVAHYFVRRKLNVGMIAGLAAVVLFAFSVGLDFKNYALSTGYQKASNPLEAIQEFGAYKEVYTDYSATSAEEGYQTLMGNSNHSRIAAIAIKYEDDGRNNMYKEKAHPGFFLSFLRVPLDAVVPKFLQGTTEFPWGLWFKDEVLQHNTHIIYSIGMTSIGFLYFTGGFIAIFLGFYFQGILLRFNEQFLFEKKILYILQFLILFSFLVEFDSVVYAIYTNLIRVLFLYPAAYWLLAKKNN